VGNSLPKERFDADSKRQLTADETDFLLRMLNTGDPLADAVIEELYRLGPDANRALLDGLANGRASLVNPPPAVDALLQQTETLPAWVEPDILHRGSTAYLTIDPLWNDIALSIGSLIHIYAAPGIARVLAATKDLTTLEIAGHRLAETAVWVYGTMLPDGLARGARGYVGTIQVRLLHARVRNAALRHGWDTAGWGTPINQVDLARTWLDFTLTPYRTLTAFGFDFTDGELRDAYHLWQYLAYLLGIDPEIYRNVAARTDVADHAEARKLLELLDVTNTAPIDQSRALVKPMMDIMTQSIVDTLKAPLPLTNDVTAAMARHIHGDALCDSLQIGPMSMAPMMPVLAFANQTGRELQRNIPGAWDHLHDTAVKKYTALIEANDASAEYRRKLETQPAAT
jgi:hypothetical protein